MDAKSTPCEPRHRAPTNRNPKVAPTQSDAVSAAHDRFDHGRRYTSEPALPWGTPVGQCEGERRSLPGGAGQPVDNRLMWTARRSGCRPCMGSGVCRPWARHRAPGDDVGGRDREDREVPALGRASRPGCAGAGRDTAPRVWRWVRHRRAGARSVVVGSRREVGRRGVSGRGCFGVGRVASSCPVIDDLAMDGRPGRLELMVGGRP
jgi:hypothetical protein